MTPDRIAELLQPFLTAPCYSELGRRHGEEHAYRGQPVTLSATQLQHISTYIDLLIRWNARINLTAIRDPEEIITRHFGESLFAARCLFPSTPSARCTLADIGSGAGFPGLPIKLWAPDIALTLIESNHKKGTFLREITRSLTLTSINIQIARAESLIAHSPARSPQSVPAPAGSGFDIVTMRAVERFESILPVATTLVAPAGRLALLISAAQFEGARHHPALTAFTWQEPAPVPLSDSRIVAIAKRVGRT